MIANVSLSMLECSKCLIVVQGKLLKNCLRINIYVPMCIDDLHAKCYESAELVNGEPKRLAAFFHHVKLRL